MLHRSRFCIALAILLVFASALAGCAPAASQTASSAATATATSAKDTATAAQTTVVAATQTPATTQAQTQAPTATPVPTERIPRTFVDDPATYPIVTIEMENGDIITAELYPHFAPNTVLNFISLINKGFYDGLTFHRLKPGFVIQGGDPTGTGSGDPGYTIDGEFSSNGFSTNTIKHTEGVLSMARAGEPNTAGSQFFVMLGTYTSLDGNYAAFGKVISGMAYVTAISIQPKIPNTDSPVTPRIMKKVTVDTKGVVYPEPYTNPK